jgi:hypothetical protein
MVGTFFAKLPAEVHTMTTRGIVAMIASFAFVSFISLQPAFAQAGQQPGQPGQPSAPQAPTAKPPAPQPPSATQSGQKSETAKGELRSVDPVKKTVTLTSDAGQQQTYQYTDTTKVTGAQGGVEGLSTMSGRQVTVTFNMKGADRVITSIEVSPK